MSLSKVTAKAAPNIAVIKYWGKKDVQQNTPINSSLSITLDHSSLYTETTVCKSQQDKHQLIVNGVEEPIVPPRIEAMIGAAEFLTGRKLYFRIESENSFPTACGMASSASAMAAIAEAICPFYKITDRDVIARIARLGSGSACRSVFGGFVLWPCEEPSIPVQLFPDDYWQDLCILIVVFSSHGKKVPSTEGMIRSLHTSTLMGLRAQIVDSRLDAMTEAIAAHNFHDFATITMQESNQLHALCLDTYPPLLYLNEHSLNLIKFVMALNSIERPDLHRTHGSDCRVGYSFDAGPNGFLFTLRKTLPLLLGLFKAVAGGNESFLADTNTLISSIPVEEPNNAMIEQLLCSENEMFDALKAMAPNIQRLIFSKVGPGPAVILSDESKL